MVKKSRNCQVCLRRARLPSLQCNRSCRHILILQDFLSQGALARLPEITYEVGKDGIVVLNLSGRGDKDVNTVAAHLGRKI